MTSRRAMLSNAGVGKPFAGEFPEGGSAHRETAVGVDTPNALSPTAGAPNAVAGASSVGKHAEGDSTHRERAIGKATPNALLPPAGVDTPNALSPPAGELPEGGSAHRESAIGKATPNALSRNAVVPTAGVRNAVAPMVGCTDRYFRRLLREITRQTTLYTEMAVAAGVVRNPALLGFDEAERPLVLQLAGDQPDALRGAAQLAAARGFDGLNLNFGCPSKAATAGGFGACMMQKPEAAVRAFGALQEASPLPVSIKCRLGVEQGVEQDVEPQDEAAEFLSFIERLHRAGCRSFVVHARKAWLKGLSPRANRSRPPLNYDFVFAAAQAFPDADFILNGGLQSPEQGFAIAKGNCSGIMLGRAVWNNPWCLASADRLIEAANPSLTRDGASVARTEDEILHRMIALSEQALSQGARVPSVLRGLTRMWRAKHGAAEWRSTLAAIATTAAQDRSQAPVLDALHLFLDRQQNPPLDRQALVETRQVLSLQT